MTIGKIVTDENGQQWWERRSSVWVQANKDSVEIAKGLVVDRLTAQTLDAGYRRAPGAEVETFVNDSNPDAFMANRVDVLAELKVWLTEVQDLRLTVEEQAKTIERLRAEIEDINAGYPHVE